MASEIFNIAFIEYIKVFITALLIYAIIYALLQKLSIFGEDKKIDSFIALLSAIIVSFSGVVTYAISYAINWFVIIFIIIFLFIIIILFLGIKTDDISKFVSNNIKPISIVFLILFSVILLKSFFALNNTFDTNQPQDNPYNIDTQYNTGVDDITNNNDNNFISNFFNSIDKELLGAVIFLIALGIFVIIIGKE